MPVGKTNIIVVVLQITTTFSYSLTCDKPLLITWLMKCYIVIYTAGWLIQLLHTIILCVARQEGWMN